jgi:hypothetical protein
MISVSSILLLVERGDQVHQAVNKALLLARHLHSRLELFLCDTERYGHAQAHTHEASARLNRDRVAAAGEFLHALTSTFHVPDVEIGTEAVCHVSMPEALREKLVRSPVDLVIKALPSNPHRPDGHRHIDWSLLSHCRVPLLYTRGRPWRPVPRFAAAVDWWDRYSARVSQAITGIGGMLTHGCGAELHILSAGEPPPGSESPPSPPDARLQQLQGEPKEVLPRFVAESDYDLVVVGRPRHRDSAALAASVAGRISRVVQGDLLFTPALDPLPAM